MARTTLASDNFNRADANPLDGSWTQLASGGGFGPAQLVSNAVEGASAGVNADSWFNGISWPNDQWAQITVIGLSNSFIGISLRQSTSGAETAYRFVFGQGSTGGSVPYIIQLANAGSFSTLRSGSATLNNGDLISAEAIGTTLNFYVGASLIDSVSDATIASGAAGFMIAPISSTGNAILDDFSGGSFSAAGNNNRISLLWW